MAVPLHYRPEPLPDETSASWLGRLAAELGHPVDLVQRMLGWEHNAVRALLPLPEDAEAWAATARLTTEQMDALFADGRRGLYGRRSFRMTASSMCPDCLDERAVWYWRWRMRGTHACVEHGLLLSHGCADCERPWMHGYQWPVTALALMACATRGCDRPQSLAPRIALDDVSGQVALERAVADGDAEGFAVLLDAANLSVRMEQGRPDLGAMLGTRKPVTAVDDTRVLAAAHARAAWLVGEGVVAEWAQWWYRRLGSVPRIDLRKRGWASSLFREVLVGRAGPLDEGAAERLRIPAHARLGDARSA